MSRYDVGIDFTVWAIRVLAFALVAMLAWEALDPGLGPSDWLVLFSYYLLGAITAAVFPRRIGIGIVVALVVAILFELLQSWVRGHDVTWVELLAKLLCALGGAVMVLPFAFVTRPRRK